MCKIPFILLVCVVVWIRVDTSDDGSEDGELELVQVLYRHGDRTPITFYPTDPWKDPKYWPVAPGELLNEGKQRHYHLGKFLRNRYRMFLSSGYIPSEILIRSSDADRTLMSTYCNLYGLFPAEGSQKWDKDTSWQPIPVHTVPVDDDMLLRAEAVCPAADEADKVAKALPEVRERQKKATHLLAYINEHSGENCTDILDLDYIYNTLWIEARMNYSLPSWTTKIYPDAIYEIAAFTFTLRSLTPTLRRLRGGPLVHEVVKNMQDKVEGRTPKQRMFIFSAHDTTVSMFLGSLQVFDEQFPPYACLVTVELRKKDGEHFVKLMFRNATDEKPNEEHVLTLPGCSALCPLSDFTRLTEPVRIRPEEWKKECQAITGEDIFLMSPLSGVGFLFLLVGVLGTALVIWYVRTRSHDPRHHLMMPRAYHQPLTTANEKEVERSYAYSPLPAIEIAN